MSVGICNVSFQADQEETNKYQVSLLFDPKHLHFTVDMITSSFHEISHGKIYVISMWIYCLISPKTLT